MADNGNGIVPVMPMGGSDFGSNSFMWIFGLLILMGLFNGGGFDTFVQVPHNNSCCPCSSPTTIQICNVGTAEATFTNINVTVEKIA